MNTSDGELARKRLLGWAWLTAVCFFNTVPLFIISVLANLAAVSPSLLHPPIVPLPPLPFPIIYIYHD